MTLLGKWRLEECWQKHADTKKWIENWVKDVEGSTWKIPQDIKRKYPKASFLSENRVIFDVKGNSYRLATKIAYPKELVLVTWIGTHREYDEWNKSLRGKKS